MKIVKIDMVFYRPCYSCITTSLKDMIGLYKNWDNNCQSFISKNEENQTKNLLLFELKNKYLKVAID